MLFFWLTMLFLMGACVGSFLNVCIYRMPLEKSVLWPGSRCGHCLQAIRWYDNLPLVSYLVLRGRCRECGSRFSVRYFLIEVLTGLCLAGLFYLDVVANVPQITGLGHQTWRLWNGFPPTLEAVLVFVHHAVLVSLLLVAFFCDMDHRTIPFGLTLLGTVLGLIGAVLYPWPWPAATTVMPPNRSWEMVPRGPEIGLYPWPVWGPLPDWLPPGSWRLGLATGLAGALAGTLLLRLVRFLFSKGLGMEALGLGDADLLMMAGSFVGWQPVVVAFFISALPGLLFGLVDLAIRKRALRRKLLLEVKAPGPDGQLTPVLQGEPVALEQFPDALAARIQATHKTEVLLDPTGLEEAVDRTTAVIGDAARQAGIGKVQMLHQRVEPDIVFGLVYLVLRWFRSTRAKLPVHLVALRQNDRVSFRVNGTEVTAEQLPAHLRKATPAPSRTTLLVDTQDLEDWIGRQTGILREACRRAGASEVRVMDRGIPFGPALAVGIVLTVLGWAAIGAYAQAALFNPWLLGGLLGFFGIAMLASSYLIRMMRLVRQ
jgi:leader peptidase (prepilin peptidase)/N-methyltransferase